MNALLPPVKINLEELRHFVCLARELHFGRAAEILGMNQSSLSRSLQRLEEHMGAALFHRTKRVVKLTPAGTVLLTEADALLGQIARTVSAVEAAARNESPVLRIGFSTPAIFDVLPKALAVFRKKYPHVQIRLSELQSDAQDEPLHRGDLDICLLFRLKGDREGLEELNTRVLLETKFIAAVPKDSSLGNKRNIKLADLADQPFLSFDTRRAPATHAAIQMACTQAGFQPKVAHEVWQLAPILSLVNHGWGVALVIELAQHICPSGVRLLPVRDMPDYLQSELLAIWSPRSSNPILNAFVQALSAARQA